MLVLTGANTFTGVTRVSGGTLGLGGVLRRGRQRRGVPQRRRPGRAAHQQWQHDQPGHARRRRGQCGLLYQHRERVRGGFANSGAAVLQNRVEGAIDNRAGTITFTGGTAGIGLVTQSAGAAIDLGANAIAFGGLAGAGTIRMENGLIVGGLTSTPVSTGRFRAAAS
jgi:autotransporter-associated beta strand protein